MKLIRATLPLLEGGTEIFGRESGSEMRRRQCHRGAGDLNTMHGLYIVCVLWCMGSCMCETGHLHAYVKSIMHDLPTIFIQLIYYIYAYHTISRVQLQCRWVACWRGQYRGFPSVRSRDWIDTKMPDDVDFIKCIFELWHCAIIVKNGDISWS